MRCRWRQGPLVAGGELGAAIAVLMQHSRGALRDDLSPLGSYVSLAPICVALLVIQYATLFAAAVTTHTSFAACLPTEYGGAFRGWLAGVCLTEEQVWCRYHGNHRHRLCPLADCRAEEVRLTLSASSGAAPPRDASGVYSGCADAIVRIWEHNYAMNGKNKDGRCGACVPPGDKRSALLPQCSEEQAACRGIFYAASRNYTGPAPLACSVAGQTITGTLSRTAAFGC